MFMRLFDWFSNTLLFYLEVIFLKNEKNHHSVPKNVNNIGWYVPYDVAFYYIKKLKFWFSISNHQSVDVSQFKKMMPEKKLFAHFPFFTMVKNPKDVSFQF